MIATPFLAHFARRLAVTKREPEPAEDEEPFEEAPIVLAGFGRVGHRIGEILTQAGIPFVALDSDVTIVEKERAKGHPVYYGDALKPEIFKNACAYSTEAIIITLNDTEATEELLVSLRKMFPDVAIFARGHNQDDCLKLRRLGATGVASENFEASMELARKALTSTGYNKKDMRAILVNFRKTYNAKIERQTRKE
jgi:voltage-gated potassium channel Kch